MIPVRGGNLMLRNGCDWPCAKLLGCLLRLPPRPRISADLLHEWPHERQTFWRCRGFDSVTNLNSLLQVHRMDSVAGIIALLRDAELRQCQLNHLYAIVALMRAAVLWSMESELIDAL